MRSKIIQDFLDRISSEEQEAMEIKIEAEIAFLDDLKAKGHKYGTATSYSLKLIKEQGFNPIGITIMMCEETFIFETSEESAKAHQACQVDNNIADGWWYGKDDFEMALIDYEDQFGEKKIHWL